MSGQHSPHDTGREENPAETDRSSTLDALYDEYQVAPTGDALHIGNLLELVIKNQYIMIKYLSKIAGY